MNGLMTMSYQLRPTLSRYRGLLAGLAVSLVVAGGCARPAGPDLQALEALARTELDEIRAPGAEIAIISGDQVVYAQGLGVSNVETSTAVKPDTLFRIGSVTKMLTASVAVGMAEDGKLDLQQPIGTYVSGLAPRLAKVTVHQLLSHTSGLKDDFSHYGPHDEAALIPSLRQYNDSHFLFQPGEGFTYSGLAYGVIGGVIEAAGGAPFADQFTARLLKPLGAERSTFRPTLAMTFPFSQGHTVTATGRAAVVRPYDDTANRWASGFLFSNVNELARFAIAFMNGGRYEGRQVLSPAVIARMSTPYVDSLQSASEKYGYGLVIENLRGVRVLKHTGSRRGFSARLAMVPDHRFAVIVLVNRAGATLYKTIERSIEMFVPLQPKPSPPAAQPLTAADIAEITGTYEKPEIHATDADRISVVLRDGRLVARGGGAEWELVKIGPSRYYGATSPISPPSEFVLKKGAEGETYLYWAMDAHRKIRNPGRI